MASPFSKVYAVRPRSDGWHGGSCAVRNGTARLDAASSGSRSLTATVHAAGPCSLVALRLANEMWLNAAHDARGSARQRYLGAWTGRMSGSSPVRQVRWQACRSSDGSSHGDRLWRRSAFRPAGMRHERPNVTRRSAQAAVHYRTGTWGPRHGGGLALPASTSLCEQCADWNLQRYGKPVKCVD